MSFRLEKAQSPFFFILLIDSFFSLYVSQIVLKSIYGDLSCFKMSFLLLILLRHYEKLQRYWKHNHLQIREKKLKENRKKRTIKVFNNFF